MPPRFIKRGPRQLEAPKRRESLAESQEEERAKNVKLIKLIKRIKQIFLSISISKAYSRIKILHRVAIAQLRK